MRRQRPARGRGAGGVRLPRDHRRPARSVAGREVEIGADLHRIAREDDREGTIWTLAESEDLNANLVRFASGGVEEHTNHEVDVLFIGVRGSGMVRVGGEEHPLGPGTAVLAPKGSRRSVKAGPAGVAYLTVHRRRAGIQLGSKPGRDTAERSWGT